MIKNFEWNDVVLYSKGWYELNDMSEESFFNELGGILAMNKNRFIDSKFLNPTSIMKWMLIIHEDICNQLHDFNRWTLRTPNIMITEIYEWIRRGKVYYDINYSFEYATCKVILEMMREIPKKDIKLTRPIYRKGNPRLRCFPISMTYKHMNDIAKKHFKEE